MNGVGISLPNGPRSLKPRSSTSMTMMFGAPSGAVGRTRQAGSDAEVNSSTRPAKPSYPRAARSIQPAFRMSPKIRVRSSANSAVARVSSWSRGPPKSISMISVTRAGRSPSTMTRSER